jgi:hypothetical protein
MQPGNRRIAAAVVAAVAAVLLGAAQSGAAVRWLLHNPAVRFQRPIAAFGAILVAARPRLIAHNFVVLAVGTLPGVIINRLQRFLLALPFVQKSVVRHLVQAHHHRLALGAGARPVAPHTLPIIN